jgi:hypothetical protein
MRRGVMRRITNRHLFWVAFAGFVAAVLWAGFFFLRWYGDQK